MLTLPIKKKWFDMICSGEKTEEYREIKPYWEKRFRKLWPDAAQRPWSVQVIKFQNGYAKDADCFVGYCTLAVGEGRPEWGAEPGKRYFVLRISKHAGFYYKRKTQAPPTGQPGEERVVYEEELLDADNDE